MGGIGKGGVFNGFQGVQGGGQSSTDQALMAMIQQQNAAIAAQQAAALQAQRDAAATAQANTAQQQATAGSQAAQQYLGQQSQVQAAKDLAAAQAASQAATSGGNAAAGGFNLAGAKQQAASNLGAAYGLPSTGANVVPGAAGSTVNPANTTAASALNQTTSGTNQYMPPMQGITFGGY
jgi:hypothetical protein